MRDFVRIVPVAALAVTLCACSSDPPCPTDASSCPSNCHSYVGDRFDSARTCFVGGLVVGCIKSLPSDGLCPMSINCRARTRTGEAFRFMSGCFPQSEDWRYCTADERGAIGLLIASGSYCPETG